MPGSTPRSEIAEVDARIVEHPFGVVGLADGGLRRKQRGVEFDGLVEVLDRDMDVEALHADLLCLLVFADAGAGLQAGAHWAALPQQFSVR